MSNYISGKMIQKMQENIERVEGWIEKLPHGAVLPRVVSQPSSHWTNFSMWDNNSRHLRALNNQYNASEPKTLPLERQQNNLRLK